MTAFQGLRVLDCSQGRAGPMAAMLLADFGAEVLKIEPPGGDRMQAATGYQMWNRNKRRLTLDVTDTAGRAASAPRASLGSTVWDHRVLERVRGASRRADGDDRRRVPPVELRRAAGLSGDAGVAIRTGDDGGRFGGRGAARAATERSWPGGDRERIECGGAGGWRVGYDHAARPASARRLALVPHLRMRRWPVPLPSHAVQLLLPASGAGDGPHCGAGRGCVPRDRHPTDGGEVPREAARRVAGDPARRRRADCARLSA